MPTEGWSSLATIMGSFAPYFSGIVALVIALFSDRLRNLFKSAKIVLADAHPVPSRLKMKIDGTDAMIPTLLYHLKVKAKWRMPLTRCRVNLVGAKKLSDSGTFLDLPTPVPHQLSWSPRYEFDQGSAVNVNGERVVDFVRLATPYMLADEQRRVMPMLYQFPPYFNGYIHAGETVRYVLQVEADGYTSDAFEFEVSWDGEWLENQPTEMSKHYWIKKV